LAFYKMLGNNEMDQSRLDEIPRESRPKSSRQKGTAAMGAQAALISGEKYDKA